MKTAIIAVICSVWSLLSLAQARVLPFSDTTKLGIQMDKLDAQYHPKQQKRLKKLQQLAVSYNELQALPACQVSQGCL